MGTDRVHRLLRLILLLQSRRARNTREIAEELEVSRRTVFRDLNMLELAHIPYHYDEESGGYRLGGHFFLPPINLELSEALSMLMLARAAGDSLPLTSQASRAAVKLESVLPAPVREYVGEVIDRTQVSVGPVAAHEQTDEVFDVLTRAVAQRRLCHAVYLSFADRKQLMLDIQPYRLMFRGRAWYVVARSEMHDEIRVFKLIRFRKVELTSRRFPAPPTDLVKKHFGKAWNMIPGGREYRVHLHFSQKVAGNVAEVLWHETQEVAFNDDGSCEFRVTVDGLGEIAWWILGYGDQVRVVKPAALRKRIAERARNMVALYEQEGET
jgi:proteasome accessory factor B